ncbi:MAG TPA: ElyC/SanA/YdcF family protein [Kineosporiaceae bacterium]|nr:ElyC/SanA/YdcF family protein [Kineosporiaceae bacterium]
MRLPSRRQAAIGVVAAMVAAVLGSIPAAVIINSTRDARFGPGATVPSRPVALVLGAGLNPDGSASPLLAQRVEVAVRLYQEGRVRALLMSGDHGAVGHDEGLAMAEVAQRAGVPASAIVLDHAGFDTFSSCYRARHVFGVRRAVVVSQAWHLPRAVWLCREQGIDTVGAGTAGLTWDVDTSGAVREVPADLKAVLDTWTGRLPTFPGPVENSLDEVNAAG